eukprot:sb/3463090/
MARYLLIDAKASQKIKISVYYTKNQRLDLYYKGKYIPPTNAQETSPGQYTYATTKSVEELTPKLSDAVGTNFFDTASHFMQIIMNGDDAFTIKTSPMVVLSLTVDVVGDADFFDEDKIIDNLAALLGIDKSKIKIANIVKESRRRKREGIDLQIEISEQPIADESEMNVTKVTEMAEALTKVSEKFVETVQKGELATALDVTVKSVAIEMPTIPPADQRNETVNQEEAEKQTGELFSVKQEKEAAADLSNQASIAVLIPDSFKLISSNASIRMLSNYHLKSKVLTSDSQIVQLLGAGDNKWRATVSVTEGPKNGRLLGTDEVTFTLGYGNLTDIRLSRKGNYKLKLKVTHPTTVNHEINDIEVEVIEQDENSPHRRIQLKFNADYSTIVKDQDDFTSYISTLLSTKYPDYTFEDVDHYEGSLIVEATVSTSTANKDDTEANLSPPTLDTQAAVKKMSSDIETAGFKIEYNGASVDISDFDGNEVVIPEPPTEDNGGDGSDGGSDVNTAAIIIPIFMVLVIGYVVIRSALDLSEHWPDPILISFARTAELWSEHWPESQGVFHETLRTEVRTGPSVVRTKICNVAFMNVQMVMKKEGTSITTLVLPRSSALPVF